MHPIVHQRIHAKHPELDERDVETAFINSFRHFYRSDGDLVCIGMDGKGRLIEMIARYASDVVIVYHAFTPPDAKDDARTWNHRLGAEVTTPQEKRLNEMLGMTEAELDVRAEAYEKDEIEFGPDDLIREGSPLDYPEEVRETFIITADDFRGVMQAVKLDGCQKSDVYRTALREYLSRRGFAHA